MDGWNRVSRQHRCPVCGGADNCTVSENGGAAWCGRVSDGSVRQNAGGQFLHVLKSSNPSREQYEHPSYRRGKEWKKKTNPKTRQNTNWSGLMQFCTERADIAAKRGELAARLGVCPTSLDRLEIGWSDKHSAWMIPERDASGRIIGVVRRFAVPRCVNGKLINKQQMHRAERGLTYALDWLDDPGPVLLVEGASDVAALLTAGVCAIGRPSSCGGVALLCELLYRLPLDRQLMVLGENDRKPHGTLKPGVQSRHELECEGCSACWPGHFGAFSTARQLSEALQRSVDVVFPPDDAKDVRDMLQKMEGVS